MSGKPGEKRLFNRTAAGLPLWAQMAGWVLFCLCACFALAGLAAPFFYHFQLPGVEQVYALGRVWCAQRPTKCLWYLNDHTALCGKCLGLHLGIMAALAAHFWWPALQRLSLRPVALWGLLPGALAICHSMYRFKYGGFDLPVRLNLLVGLASGFGLILALNTILRRGIVPVMKLTKTLAIKIGLAALVLTLLPCASALAADQGTTAAVPEVRLPSGTPVILETEYSFDTGLVREGDTIYLRVVRAVYAQKVKVIRVGVAAKARIISCRPASGWGGRGDCVLGVRSVQAIDGSDVRLEGRMSRAGEESHGEAAAVAVGAGILCWPAALAGGAVKGEEAAFPVGFEVVAHVAGDQMIKLLPEPEVKDIIHQQDVETRLKMEGQRERMKELRKKREEEQIQQHE